MPSKLHSLVWTIFPHLSIHLVFPEVFQKKTWNKEFFVSWRYQPVPLHAFESEMHIRYNIFIKSNHRWILQHNIRIRIEIHTASIFQAYILYNAGYMIFLVCAVSYRMLRCIVFRHQYQWVWSEVKWCAADRNQKQSPLELISASWQTNSDDAEMVQN